MRNKRNQTGTAAVVSQTLDQLRTTIEQLEIAMRSSIPEEASDLIIGAATRLGIERLNVVRDEFGFDQIPVGESAGPAAANDRLSAAAPTMLLALKQARHLLEDLAGGWPGTFAIDAKKCREVVDSAIFDADGKKRPRRNALDERRAINPTPNTLEN